MFIGTRSVTSACVRVDVLHVGKWKLTIQNTVPTFAGTLCLRIILMLFAAFHRSPPHIQAQLASKQSAVEDKQRRDVARVKAMKLKKFNLLKVAEASGALCVCVWRACPGQEICMRWTKSLCVEDAFASGC